MKRCKIWKGKKQPEIIIKRALVICIKVKGRGFDPFTPMKHYYNQ